MKKRIISALAALMLLISVFTVAVSADDTYAKLKFQNVGRVTAGSTFTLTLKLDNIDKELTDSGIRGVAFELVYDRSLIETTDKSVKLGGVSGDTWEINCNVDGSSSVFFACYIENDDSFYYYGDKDLTVSFEFTVSSDAAGKAVVIGARDASITSADCEDLEVATDVINFNIEKSSAVSASIGGNTYLVDEENLSASLSAVSDKSVTTFTVPSEVTYNGKTLKVASIESGAFADLSSLTSVYIPCAVKSVSSGIFSSNANVTVKGCNNSAAHSFAVSEGCKWEVVTTNYKETVIKESTCLEHGYSQLACPDCEATAGAQNELPLTEHEYGDWVITKEATDDEVGSRERTCAVCSVKQTEVIPKTNCKHESTKDVIVKEPTCTEVGSKNVVCDNCNEVVEENVEIPKIAHSFGDWVVIKEATVKEKGSRERTCTVCGAKETEDIPSLACKHTNTTNGHRDATCTNDGYDSTTCKDCGTLLSYTKISAKHTEGPTETKAATCTEDGYEIQKCTACGEVLKNVVIPAEGHEYGDWTVLAPATVDNDGVRTHTCSKCGNNENEPIPQLDPPADESEEPSVPELESSAPAEDSSAATSTPDDSTGGSNKTVFLVIGIVVILLTVGYIVVMAINKRKNY